MSAALARAERENLRFVFLAKGDKLRLHVTGNIHGVGRKGPAETLIEVDMPLLHHEQLAYVPLIFSARAIANGGTFERILSESRDYSVKLSERLRDRIYVDVVPSLAVAVAQANSEDSLDDVYEQSLVLLFRLLFVAYAEDRDLLPYRRNDRYRNASLKALARELADLAEEGKNHSGDETTSLWARVNTLFEAVDKGAPTWDVPAYNGGLFSADEDVNEAGTALANIDLSNEQLGHALTALLVEPGGGDLPAAPVDFRSLSVRDFGTIYEGLLESGISEAPEDLTLDSAGNYVPANGRDPVVHAGAIYHHNRGGARKATGPTSPRTLPSSTCSIRPSFPRWILTSTAWNACWKWKETEPRHRRSSTTAARTSRWGLAISSSPRSTRSKSGSRGSSTSTLSKASWPNLTPYGPLPYVAWASAPTSTRLSAERSGGNERRRCRLRRGRESHRS